MSSVEKPPFWLVWSPTGDRPPSYRHTTEDAALREANRLADANPGRVFYVMQPTLQVVSQRRLTTRYSTDDMVPF